MAGSCPGADNSTATTHSRSRCLARPYRATRASAHHLKRVLPAALPIMERSIRNTILPIGVKPGTPYTPTAGPYHLVRIRTVSQFVVRWTSRTFCRFCSSCGYRYATAPPAYGRYNGFNKPVTLCRVRCHSSSVTGVLLPPATIFRAALRLPCCARMHLGNGCRQPHHFDNACRRVYDSAWHCALICGAATPLVLGSS